MRLELRAHRMHRKSEALSAINSLIQVEDQGFGSVSKSVGQIASTVFIAMTFLGIVRQLDHLVQEWPTRGSSPSILRLLNAGINYPYQKTFCFTTIIASQFS